MMSANQPNAKCNPLLRELNLVTINDQKQFSGKKKNAYDGGAITALGVLNHLLETNVLTQEDVRSAVKSMQGAATKSSSSTNEIEKQPAPLTKEEAKNNAPPTQYRTRHIALRFFYDGANFSGLAENLGQDSDNSVEKTLFQALAKSRLLDSRETSGYSRCGRTDKGVSAAGQVVALYIKSAIPKDASFDEEGKFLIPNDDLPKNEFETIKAWITPKKKKKASSDGAPPSPRIEKELVEYPYTKILNNILPTPEIRILGWAPVSEDFSARFSATTRTYRYFFCKRQMDLGLIREGLKLLVGRHDFRNFCKMDIQKVYNFERVIHDAELVELSDGGGHGEVCYLQIFGQAFLWHQIRCIAEILFMIGKGMESPTVISELHNIEKYPGKPSYHLADEKPLVLHHCGYPNLHVGYSVQNLWAVSCQLEKQWEELTLAAARMRDGIQSLQELSVLKKDVVDFATAKLTERGKKLRRVGLTTDTPAINDLKLEVEDDDENSATLVWNKVLPWLKQHDLVPDANGMKTMVQIPLLQRSKGTTYEEKIEALKYSEKRRQKFEENVIKKRKTAEEDAAFYKHKTKQGGAGM